MPSSPCIGNLPQGSMNVPAGYPRNESATNETRSPRAALSLCRASSQTGTPEKIS